MNRIATFSLEIEKKQSEIGKNSHEIGLKYVWFYKGRKETLIFKNLLQFGLNMVLYNPFYDLACAHVT